MRQVCAGLGTANAVATPSSAGPRSPSAYCIRNLSAIIFVVLFSSNSQALRAQSGSLPPTKLSVSKLVGVVWIDPADKQVMRPEARLAEGFKMAGGLLVNLRPAAAMVMEQTRMVEGIWLPRMAQVNLSVKVLLFGGGDYNQTIEWSDYKHFSGEVSDYKLDAPKPNVSLERSLNSR